MKLAGFTITRDKKQRSEQSLQNEVEIALKRIATEERSASQQEKEPPKWLPALRFGAPSVANRRNYNRHELIAEYKAPLCASIKETYRRSINDESFTDRRISTAAEEIICDEFRSAKFDVCFQRKLLSILSISVFFSVGLTTTLFTSVPTGLALLVFGTGTSALAFKKAWDNETRLDNSLELARIAERNNKDASVFPGDKGIYKRAARRIRKKIKKKEAVPGLF